MQQKDVSDEDVARAINQKLGDTPGVSYSDIAARAYGCGRTELAIKVCGRVTFPRHPRERGVLGPYTSVSLPSTPLDSYWSMSHAQGSRYLFS